MLIYVQFYTLLATAMFFLIMYFILCLRWSWGQVSNARGIIRVRDHFSRGYFTYSSVDCILIGVDFFTRVNNEHIMQN